MAIVSSGQLSLTAIRDEFGAGTTSNLNLRTLSAAANLTVPDGFNEFYGLSNLLSLADSVQNTSYGWYGYPSVTTSSSATTQSEAGWTTSGSTTPSDPFTFSLDFRNNWYTSPGAETDIDFDTAQRWWRTQNVWRPTDAALSYVGNVRLAYRITHLTDYASIGISEYFQVYRNGSIETNVSMRSGSPNGYYGWYYSPTFLWNGSVEVRTGLFNDSTPEGFVKTIGFQWYFEAV